MNIVYIRQSLNLPSALTPSVRVLLSHPIMVINGVCVFPQLPTTYLKGQWHRIFDLRFFSCISFTCIPLRIFLKIHGDIRSLRCTTSVDTCGKWKKSSIRKVLIILFGLIPIFCRRYQQHQWYRWQNLPPVSLIPVVHLEWRISPQIFEKIWNDPYIICRGLWEIDSWNKSEAKNLVTLSLSVVHFPI